jgi:outer membrane protein assembly factor BamD
MKLTSAILSLATGLLFAGCSLPSMPSWSGSQPKVDATADALFQDGMKYFKEKRYARALDHFTKLKTEHPFSPQLTQAELYIADAYYLNQQYPEAINAFKEFEAMHPSNENMPFVIYRLGLSYFDQFTTVDRDQKNTEIAKTYFETVIAKFPKSPYALEAKDKLAKCNGYLAEHDFNIAHFYLQQEKYPAARDRFEEIVRKYRGTPAAAKSLFFLGESYRNEKNNVKAVLAYEALLQHYPESQFASQARTQLARVEKEKNDPLALLLMRDRRPATAVAQEKPEVKTAGARKEPENLVAKTEMVYEEPGAEKGVFRRVVDKINPFASSDDGKKTLEQKPQDSTRELLAKKKAMEQQQSPGMLAGLWRTINPFSGNEAADKTKPATSGGGALVERVDDSLSAKGIDAKTQTAALRPPRADLPKMEEAAPVQTTDTSHLLGTIDSTLKKGGRNAVELPPVPAAADAFNQPQAEALAARGAAKAEAPQPIATSGLLGDIDQKLKAQGVDPANIELPAPAVTTTQKPAATRSPTVELEPKMAAAEKGSLFLSPPEVQGQQKAEPEQDRQENKVEGSAHDQQPAAREIPKALVRGPTQATPAPAATKPAPRVATRIGEEEEQGPFDRMMQDAENLGKLLNPFRW